MIALTPTFTPVSFGGGADPGQHVVSTVPSPLSVCRRPTAWVNTARLHHSPERLALCNDHWSQSISKVSVKLYAGQHPTRLLRIASSLLNSLVLEFLPWIFGRCHPAYRLISRRSAQPRLDEYCRVCASLDIDTGTWFDLRGLTTSARLHQARAFRMRHV